MNRLFAALATAALAASAAPAMAADTPPPVTLPFLKLAPSLFDLPGIGPYTADADGPNEAVVNLTKTWMGKIEDERMLGELSIPGSHNSAAVSCGLVCTNQVWSLTQQLDAGIRFLDLRIERMEKGIELRHGSRVLDLTLPEAMAEITGWLDANPTETIIMILQDQKSSKKDVVDFKDAWDDLGLDQYEGHLARRSKLNDYTSIAGIPLGEVRGQIVLWRRYVSGFGTFGFSGSTKNKDDEDLLRTYWQKKYAISAIGGGDTVTPAEKRVLIQGSLSGAVATGVSARFYSGDPKDYAGKLSVNFIGGSTTAGAGIAQVVGLGISDALALSPIRKASVFNPFTSETISSLCPIDRRCTMGIVYGDALTSGQIYNIVRTNF